MRAPRKKCVVFHCMERKF